MFNTKITLPTELVWHSISDELPEHDNMCLVVCKTKAGMYSWNRAYYSDGFFHGSGSMSGVIAWANFNLIVEDV